MSDTNTETLVQQLGGNDLTNKMVEYSLDMIKRPASQIPQSMKADFIDTALAYATTDIEFYMGADDNAPEKAAELPFWVNQAKKGHYLAYAGAYYTVQAICESRGFIASMIYGDTTQLEEMLPKLKPYVDPLDQDLEKQPELAGNPRAKLATVYKAFLTQDNSQVSDIDKNNAFNFMMIESVKAMTAEDVKKMPSNTDVCAKGMFMLSQTFPLSYIEEKPEDIEQCSGYKLFQENKEAGGDDAWRKFKHMASMKVTGLDKIVQLVEYEKRTGEKIVLA